VLKKFDTIALAFEIGCISIFWQMFTGQSLQKWYFVEQCNEQTKN